MIITTPTAPFGKVGAQDAADRIRGRLGAEKTAAAIILGSGLGGLAERIEAAVHVPFAEIPGFPAVTVAGHTGVLMAGKLGGRRVLALAGRFHMYEGHEAALAAFPTRVLYALGARSLIVSNAAGGIRPTLRPGDLMLIRDHINFMFRNPLIGPIVTGETRFPDMSSPYDAKLGAIAHDVALREGLALTDGAPALLAERIAELGETMMPPPPPPLEGTPKLVLVAAIILASRCPSD